MPLDCRIVVFISGRGSNLHALVEKSSNYRIIAVVSDNPEAPGLEFARAHGITEVTVSRSSVKTRSEQREHLYSLTRDLKPDLIALAGFMQILDAPFVKEFYGRIVNIHPSLLPAFPGLHTHERAIEAKATRHGCTVHFVDSGVDTGPIIAQAACACLPDDTKESLAERVLALEHRLYPWVLSGIASAAITLSGNSVQFSKSAREQAQQNDFLIS